MRSNWPALGRRERINPPRSSSARVIDDNTISREFHRMDEMEVKYHRCQI
jgi:hypothetical protein